MNDARCECEHVEHFGSNPGHTYGDPNAVAIREIKTPYGTFKLCAECVDDRHMHVADSVLRPLP